MLMHRAALSAATPAAAVLDQAILPELGADERAEVRSHATTGNALHEVLEAIPRDTIELRHSADHVATLDRGPGPAIVETPEGQPRTTAFAKKTQAFAG